LNGYGSAHQEQFLIFIGCRVFVENTRYVNFNSRDKNDLMSTRVWLALDEQHLKQVREASGMDVHDLSRRCLLSVNQIQALEGQGNGKQFYSEAIKFAAGTKALAALGAKPLEPPEPPPAVIMMAKPSAESEQAQPKAPSPYAPRLKGYWIKVSLLALAFIIAALVYVGRDGVSSDTPPAAPQQPLAPQAQPAPQAPAPEIAAPKRADKPEIKAPEREPFDCAQMLKSDKTQVFKRPLAPIKPGNYVHFAAKRPTTVCVEDAQGRVTTLELSKGEAKSVYGSPPFKVWHPNATIVQMYYQGLKVSGRTAKAGVTLFQP
jgi:hypothetical protein